MVKINKLDLNTLVSKLIESVVSWIKDNKLRIFVFLPLTLLWVTSSSLPYLNLVLTKKLVIFLVIVSSFFVFKMSWKTILYLCLLFVVGSYLFTILGFVQEAETLASYIYGFLIVVAIKFFATI